MSLSSWRAWIEITLSAAMTCGVASRSPHGERGLKYGQHRAAWRHPTRRSPHGERGLKFVCPVGLPCCVLSLSSWRAWIEIMIRWSVRCIFRRSPHGERGLKSLRINGKDMGLPSLSSWRAWIEIYRNCLQLGCVRSLSSWRAWIEIAIWSGSAPRLLGRSPHGERGLK